MDFLLAFVIGGLICVAAQITLDATPLTPAHVMVLFVSLGAIASALGLYQPLVELAGAGATIPLPSFGHALVQGMLEEFRLSGWLGLISGGLKATSLALTVAIIMGFLTALVFNPRD